MSHTGVDGGTPASCSPLVSSSSARQQFPFQRNVTSALLHNSISAPSPPDCRGFGASVCDTSSLKRAIGELPSPAGRMATLDAIPSRPPCSSSTDSAGEWVYLSVGGKLLISTIATLCSDPHSLLAHLCESLPTCSPSSSPVTPSATPQHVDPMADHGLPSSSTANTNRDLPLDADHNRCILLDLDYDYFLPVLNYLRHREVIIPPHISPKGVLAAAKYLNVQGVIRQLAPGHRNRRQLLFSWGSGTSGELGTQLFLNSAVPTLVQVTPFGVKVVHVALGANYSCALSDDGNVYTFGNGEWGQLGLGPLKQLELHPLDDSAVAVVPRRIPLFEKERAIHISAGYAFAMAITEGHHVYFWGNNNHGQSGLGPTFFDYNLKKIDEPRLVESLEGKRIVQLGCGSFFSLALGADGVLYSWGLVDCLGLGTPEEVVARYGGSDILDESLSNEKRDVLLTPQVVEMESPEPVVRIHAGQWHSGAINAAGELFTWGVGYQGRLGHGSRDASYRPKRVGGALEGHAVVDVACGSFHTVALTNRGVVFCWGDNSSGQCGTRALHMESFPSPYRVVGLEFVAGGVARSISCGRQHTEIVMEGPQPDCQRECCQLNYEGRTCGSHAQIYTFGDDGRGLQENGNSSQQPVSTSRGSNNRSAFVAQDHWTPFESTSSARHGAGRGGISNANSTAPDRAERSQFYRIPGLETLDIRGVTSGLHHSFVYAEELPGTDSRDGWNS